MTITISNTATVYEGKDSIGLLRLMTMVQGLRLEVKGMRLCRGRTCYAIAKEEFGLKGSKEKVLAALETILAERKASAVVVDERTA
jgi:hypothetical protein